MLTTVTMQTLGRKHHAVEQYIQIQPRWARPYIVQRVASLVVLDVMLVGGGSLHRAV